MAGDVNANSGGPLTGYIDRRLLVTSAMLVGAGLLAGMAGATVASLAAARAWRGYLGNMGEPPQMMARRRWQQARSATGAALGAWQDYDQKAHSVK